MKLRIAFASVVMMTTIMCSNSDPTGDAGSDAPVSCESNASAACGAAGGDFSMTTVSGCTGSTCPSGEICLATNDVLGCVALTAVCSGSAGTVQAIIACKANGDCPARMMCGSLNTCVPNCSGDGG